MRQLMALLRSPMTSTSDLHSRLLAVADCLDHALVPMDADAQVFRDTMIVVAERLRAIAAELEPLIAGKHCVIDKYGRRCFY